MTSKHRLSEAGYTLVETVLAVSVAAIMIGVLFSITFSYYTNAVQSQAAASMALESQTILSQMVEDLRLADGTALNNEITDPNAPGGVWTTSDANNVLVIRYPAVTADRDIIYQPDTGFPYQNEFVYFINGTSMHKRILKNTGAVGNAAETSCPAASATPTCRADPLFSTDVSDLTFTLYDINNNVTTDPAQARSVKLTVSLSKVVFGKTISMSNTTQVTQRNQ